MDTYTATHCRVPECPKRTFRGWLCRRHYERKRRYGGPGVAGKIGKAAPIEDRFVNNVRVDGPIFKTELGPCSQWMGYVHRSGFGVIGCGKRVLYVHRYAWEQVRGPLPVKVRIFQICGNRRCVRVDHLQARNTSGEVLTP